MWEIEGIPNEDFVFRRIHKNEMDPANFGIIPPNAFREFEGGISCDWNKYSTPSETQLRAKNPELISVVAINVGKIRSLEKMEVQHSPIENNRAHANILGLNTHVKAKRTKIRLKLAEYSEWRINEFI